MDLAVRQPFQLGVEGAAETIDRERRPRGEVKGIRHHRPVAGSIHHGVSISSSSWNR